MRYRIRETIASAFGAVIVALALLAAPAPTIAARPLQWPVVASPTSPTTDSGLNGVSCASASSCIAVGFYLDGSGFSRTLIEKWDGTSWTAASSPNASSASNSLSGVSCASAGSCTAVGSYDTGAGLF